VSGVDYADRTADEGVDAVQTFNGFYIYKTTHFERDSGSMDAGRLEPAATQGWTNATRLLIVPSGDNNKFDKPSYKGSGDDDNTAMSAIGGLFTTSSSLHLRDDMKQNDNNLETDNRYRFQKMCQLIRNEPVQYDRNTANNFPYFRIQDLPSRIDQADVVVVILRADPNTGNNGLALPYDHLMANDSVQAYQLRGAFDYNGKTSDVEGVVIHGTTTRMPRWFLNSKTVSEPEGVALKYIEKSGQLDAYDTAVFANESVKGAQFLHHQTSTSSLQYSRRTEALLGSQATYDSDKIVYQFRAANSLVLEDTESIPLFD
jgi:hypothetical protein